MCCIVLCSERFRRAMCGWVAKCAKRHETETCCAAGLTSLLDKVFPQPPVLPSEGCKSGALLAFLLDPHRLSTIEMPWSRIYAIGSDETATSSLIHQLCATKYQSWTAQSYCIVLEDIHCHYCQACSGSAHAQNTTCSLSMEPLC